MAERQVKGEEETLDQTKKSGRMLRVFGTKYQIVQQSRECQSKEFIREMENDIDKAYEYSLKPSTVKYYKTLSIDKFNQ